MDKKIPFSGSSGRGRRLQFARSCKCQLEQSLVHFDRHNLAPLSINQNFVSLTDETPGEANIRRRIWCAMLEFDSSQRIISTIENDAPIML
ncbi:MAG TPA: hypothetical protein VN648_19510, partial [Candidatus Methylomirabilis sp.]|nr:hypothetical protein [Candidatus Methylomirabilis sp.]